MNGDSHSKTKLTNIDTVSMSLPCLSNLSFDETVSSTSYTSENKASTGTGTQTLSGTRPPASGTTAT